MPLRQIWEVGMTALMHRTDQWESKAHLAVRALAAQKELLLLLPTWESIKADITRFWGEAHAVSEGLFNNFLAGMPVSVQLHISSYGSRDLPPAASCCCLDCMHLIPMRLFKRHSRKGHSCSRSEDGWWDQQNQRKHPSSSGNCQLTPGICRSTCNSGGFGSPACKPGL